MADDMMVDSDVEALVEGLRSPRRRLRQDAAHRLALVAHENVTALLPFVADLIDSLYRPEAQTRWEAFDALTQVALEDPSLVEEGYDGAEAALFDEGSATVRLAAFRFLCRLGASSPARSDLVWQIVDEAVQCYHGNPEYRDMLVALLEFSRGQLSPQTAEALAARVRFDADNGQGFVKSYSTQIIATAKGGE